ncbi:MAG: hypothetical protein WCO57_05715 [Verrucomicrobiota bacterium]
MVEMHPACVTKNNLTSIMIIRRFRNGAIFLAGMAFGILITLIYRTKSTQRPESRYLELSSGNHPVDSIILWSGKKFAQIGEMGCGIPDAVRHVDIDEVTENDRFRSHFLLALDKNNRAKAFCWSVKDDKGGGVLHQVFEVGVNGEFSETQRKRD